MKSTVDRSIVTVDYDEPNALNIALNRVCPDWLRLALNLSQLHLVGGAGTVTHEVFRVNFSCAATMHDLQNKLPAVARELEFKSGFIYVDLLTALQYVIQVGGQEYPTATFFAEKRQRPSDDWFLLLFFKGGLPPFLISPYNSDSRFEPKISFLIVPKVAAAF